MSNMINLKKLALEATGGSELMEGRTPIDTNAVVNYCKNDVLTIYAFDWLEAMNKQTKELQQYPIVLFKELEENYYAGGKQLNDLCRAIQSAGAESQLAEEGLPVKFEMIKTSDGNNFVKVTVC